jgi:hypothetical protein
MRKFIKKLLLFSLPFFVLTILTTIGSLSIGEAIPISMIIEMQIHDSSIIYQPNWLRQDIMYYKYLGAISRHPEILILGSSRINQFRSAFFDTQAEHTYNAAIPSLDMNEIKRFLDALIEAEEIPHILIFNIDLPYFNADESQVSFNRLPFIVPPKTYIFDYVPRAVRRTASEWVENPSILPSHLANSLSENRRFYGIFAMTNAYGFRHDGSRYYRGVESNLANQLRVDWQRLNKGEDWFEHGTEVNIAALADLESTLQQAQAQGIIVIAILPPYHHEFYHPMLESNNYAYLDKARSQIRLLFNEYGMYLFDYTDTYPSGGSDDELYDSWHPGELLSLRITLDIVQSLPDIFAASVDTKVLQSMIDSAESPFFVFGDNQ